MIPGFEAIVEERIKKAQKDGGFDNLSGQGKPLEFDDVHVPEELRMAHKVLKNAGFLPPEIEMKKKISHFQELLGSVGDSSPERANIQKKLNYLITKLETSRGSDSCTGLLADQYRHNIIEKLS